MTIIMSGVHVLLVSLFGIPIVQSISHIFGRPKNKFSQPKKIWYTSKNLVYQKEIWSTKKIFSIPKKNLVDQKNVKLTGQLVYQRE